MSTSKTQKFGKRNQQSCIRQCCIIHSRIYQNTPSSKSISIICNILTRYFCMLIAQLLIVYTLFTAKKQPFNSKWRSKSIKHYVLPIWYYQQWDFHFFGHFILEFLLCFDYIFLICHFLWTNMGYDRIWLASYSNLPLSMLVFCTFWSISHNHEAQKLHDLSLCPNCNSN